MSSTKTRLDLLLVELGLAPSRERAQSLILAGKVLLADEPATKAGQAVKDEDRARVRLREQDHGYVSRGALKLLAALDQFGVQPRGVGLDIGASTGGFTQVLLERGAAEVYAIDVGQNQLDWKVRSDPRVHVHEKVNARNLEFSLIGRTVDLIVMDVSFISITKILPALLVFATPETDWITLIKPQFEVGRERVGKGGIVVNEDDRLSAVAAVTSAAESLGLRRLGLIDSPITGTDGNHEYLARFRLYRDETPKTP